MAENAHRRRIVAVSTCMVLCMIGLGTRLAFLHMGLAGQAEPLERGRSYQRTLVGEYGKVFDRRGHENILACDRVAHDIWVDPRRIQEEESQLKVVNALLRLEAAPRPELFEKVNRKNTQFAYVKRRVPADFAGEVAGLNLKGVHSREIKTRLYPHGQFLCHVLGFQNHQGVGSAGVEQAMRSYLKGSPGYLESKKDGLRKELFHKRERYIAPQDGHDVCLTIDQYIQDNVETVLDDVMQEHHAKGAWAIVQNVRTGEILAMASRPGYDPNLFTESTPDQRMNRAISYNYEPGSTLKAVTIAMAIERGYVNPGTVINCENGSWYYAKRLLRDYHGYSQLSVADVLKKSSNIGTAKLALMLGDAELERALRSFGLGRQLGIGLPGEETGILHSYKKWSKLSATRISIGQGVSATALQVISVYSAIANGGYLMKPYVIKEVRDSEGHTVRRSLPQVLSQPLEENTALTMRLLLARVTETGGTGRRARVDGYRVAGKTGTAQKVINGVYSEEAHVASFVGFLPVKDPQLSIIVVVDEPQPIHTGGRVAAPAFQKIASHAVRYLDIPPDDPATRRMNVITAMHQQ